MQRQQCHLDAKTGAKQDNQRPQAGVIHCRQRIPERLEFETAGLYIHQRNRTQHRHGTGKGIGQIAHGITYCRAATQRHDEKTRPADQFPADEQAEQIATGQQCQHAKYIQRQCRMKSPQTATGLAIALSPFTAGKPAGKPGGAEGNQGKVPGKSVEAPVESMTEHLEAQRGFDHLQFAITEAGHPQQRRTLERVQEGGSPAGERAVTQHEHGKHRQPGQQQQLVKRRHGRTSGATVSI